MVIQILNLLTLITSPYHKEGGETLEAYVIWADWFLVALPYVVAGESWVWFYLGDCFRTDELFAA